MLHRMRCVSTTCRIVQLPRDVRANERVELAVLIDVQRATSTLVTAFAHGLQHATILPEVDLVRAAAAAETRVSGTRSLLGGERDFVAIEGFDYCNSPRAYRDDCETLKGRSLYFTSTNGARALVSLEGRADSIALGSFLNLSAVVEACSGARSVLLLCSGTHGQRSDEDELFAGTVAAALQDGGATLADCDATREVVAMARLCATDEALWWRQMRESANGAGLARNGLSADVDFVAQTDLFAATLPLLVKVEHPHAHRRPLFALSCARKKTDE